MNPLFRIDFSISDSLKIVRKSVLIYETIILSQWFALFLKEGITNCTCKHIESPLSTLLSLLAPLNLAQKLENIFNLKLFKKLEGLLSVNRRRQAF